MPLHSLPPVWFALFAPVSIREYNPAHPMSMINILLYQLKSDSQNLHLKLCLLCRENYTELHKTIRKSVQNLATQTYKECETY